VSGLKNKEWGKRDLSTKEYAYIWADRIYFNVRLSDDRPCLLVLIGAPANVKKELIMVYDGIRESKLQKTERTIFGNFLWQNKSIRRLLHAVAEHCKFRIRYLQL